MKRDVGFIPNHPTVMSRRRDVENCSRRELVNFTALHRRGRLTSQHHPEVFYFEKRSPRDRTDVLCPFPSGLVRSSSDRHPADLNDFKSSLLKLTYFVRAFEPFQNHFE